MGLFKKEEKNCIICDDTMKGNNMFLDGKYYCPNCGSQLMHLKLKPAKITSAEAKKALSASDIVPFHPTKKIDTYLEVDENSKQWRVTGMFSHKGRTHKYSDILDFELLEDGDSVTKGGLGRAIAGGALLGGVGAIVGGVTGKKTTKSVCNSLKIKITINNLAAAPEYISFISSSTKKDSMIYKGAYTSAQQCLSALQVICKEIEQSAPAPSGSTAPGEPASVADELLKWKGLLDAGAISQEEFDAQKAKILNAGV